MRFIYPVLVICLLFLQIAEWLNFKIGMKEVHLTESERRLCDADCESDRKRQGGNGQMAREDTSMIGSDSIRNREGPREGGRGVIED